MAGKSSRKRIGGDAADLTLENLLSDLKALVDKYTPKAAPVAAATEAPVAPAAAEAAPAQPSSGFLGFGSLFGPKPVQPDVPKVEARNNEAAPVPAPQAGGRKKSKAQKRRK